MSDWTEARIEALKLMWTAGCSASEVARRLGGVTRNAVIGKVHRLGLEFRGRDAPRAKVSSVPRSIADKIAAFVPPPEPIVEEPPIMDGSRITLMHLTDRTCRWPIGDPQERDFHFCGNVPHPQSPYCDAHHAKAYVPMPKPRHRRNAADPDVQKAKEALRNTGLARLFG